MPGRYNFDVDKRSTWRQRLRYTQPSSSSRAPAAPVDITGWDAILQARVNVEDPDPLFTVDTRAQDGDGEFEPFDASGVIQWSVDMDSVADLPDKALYGLMLIDPDGHGHLILEGQLQFVMGVIDGP